MKSFPLSLPTRPWQSYSVILIGLLFLSSYIYWHVTASCYDEGSDNFPGPVFCHYTLLFLQRNTCSGNWSLPLTSSSSRRTGLGCCCFCLFLCCSSSHILLPLQQGNRNEMVKQGKLFFPYQNATDSWNHQGLLEQAAMQHLSALACCEAGAARGDLGTGQKPFKGLSADMSLVEWHTWPETAQSRS